MKWEFTHHGQPRPMPRPRFGRGRAYTPASILGHMRELEALWLKHGPDEPLDCPVALYVRFWRENRRRVDIDNCIKVVMDAATKAGVWLDDSLVHRIDADLDFDTKSPRTEVRLEIK